MRFAANYPSHCAIQFSRSGRVQPVLAVGLALALCMHLGRALAADVAGDWHASIDTPAGKLPLALTVRHGAHGLEGQLSSPQQGPAPKPLAEISADHDTLSFAVPAVRASFKGRWQADSTSWTGEWTQPGGARPLSVKKGKLPARPTVPGLDGEWRGALNHNGASLRMVLRVFSGVYGTFATWDSPDQMANGMPASAISREGSRVHAELALVGGKFAGELDTAGVAIDGTWTQGALALPLRLVRSTQPASPAARPQHPQAPWPYQVEMVSYPNKGANITLAGTLTLPRSAGPHPAVILISGSGSQDRDQTIFGHKPFLVIADYLTRRGFAVLRYDDRGAGASTGDPTQATTADFATDVEAGLAFLRSRTDIDARRIGLAGHSEGGLIAPMVAAHDPAVAFIVLLAAPAGLGSEALLLQQRALAFQQGATVKDVEAQTPLMRALSTSVRGQPDMESAQRAARAVLAKGPLPPGFTPQMQDMAVRQITSNWFRFFLEHDANAVLTKVRCPILAVNGSLDIQVPSSALADIQRSATASSSVTVVELPRLNHLFQTSRTGSPGEYAENEETFAPAALDVIGQWLTQQARLK